VRRAVRSRIVRTAIAVSGVTVSALLVLVLVAGYRGVTAGVESYVGQDRIDLWVSPPGTDNLIRSSGLLPASLACGLARIAGVAAADPMLRGFVSVSSATQPRAMTLLAVGCRLPDGLGVPPRLAAGSLPARPGEVTLDRAAAHRLGVRVGDSVTVNLKRFRVAGLSSGTNLLATQFIFLDGPSAEQATGVFNRASFIGVKLAADADPAAVRRRILETYEDVQVFDRAEWVRNNANEVAAGFRPLLVLITAVGTVSAAVLVALLVQAVVDDRRQDIAVLLALGAPLSVVARSVVIHSASLVAGGACLGGALTLALAALLRATTPLLELAPRVTDLLWVLAAFGLAGLLVTLAPLLRLRRIDPAEAFRP